ncbi:ROK family protein [Tsukamurella sputi]|uniref:ROK family protein n=1 Tax=Tsukamurella sputi TaxID=2591848 RepID=A0A5C5RNJ3_9ACTN|nr:ROK family protein [Tsukamurella sputi]TWS23665.1 ROK family protein [Tsukamurella sputi]
MTVLAVDLGGTKVAAALVEPDGTVVEASRHRAPTGPEATTAELEASITEVVRDALAAADGPVQGVGLAAAGPVDDAAGTTSPINLEALHGFPLRDLVADAAGGLSVEFRRDGVAIVLGEHWLGAARGHDDALGMVVSTGIGGGFIVGGRALVGNAGHIGQVEVSGYTGSESLGRTTMLESVASGPHTVEWARTQGFAGTTGEELGEAYRAGDEVAVAAVRRCAAAVGQGIGSAVALVPVSVVVLGGGFTRVADDFVALVQSVVAEHPLPYVAGARVVPAGLGSDAPLIGAAALVYRRNVLS